MKEYNSNYIYKCYGINNNNNPCILFVIECFFCVMIIKSIQHTREGLGRGWCDNCKTQNNKTFNNIHICIGYISIALSIHQAKSFRFRMLSMYININMFLRFAAATEGEIS